MEDWKNTDWQDKAFQKPMRFWIRDEIEEIIKEENIDRIRFHEFSKIRYMDIIRKFYFTFCDKRNYVPTSKSDFLNSIHFRDSLKSYNIDCFFRTYDWIQYLKTIKEEIPDNKEKLYLILEQGWVYEGYPDTVFSVLNETDCWLSNFYILSSKFEWFISVSDIEDNAIMYKR